MLNDKIKKKSWIKKLTKTKEKPTKKKKNEHQIWKEKWRGEIEKEKKNSKIILNKKQNQKNENQI